MKQNKIVSRRRRAARIRYSCAHNRKTRLVAHRTTAHIYAQIIDADAKVLVSASSAEKDMRKKFSHGNTLEAASAVGTRIADKAKKAKINFDVVFDRSGFKYHGRIKALADAARTGGMKF